MTSHSGNMGGLLLFGAVLAVAAIAIKAGLRDESAPGDAVDAPGASNTTAHQTLEGEQDMFGFAGTKAAGGAIDHADDTNFQQKVLDVDGRVLVDFYADWCGPCRMIAPVLEELAREIPNARIVKVNVDHSPNLASHFQIESIPALIVFENGRPVEQHVGLASKNELRSMLVN